jgi:hypothetical protein
MWEGREARGTGRHGVFRPGSGVIGTGGPSGGTRPESFPRASHRSRVVFRSLDSGAPDLSVALGLELPAGGRRVRSHRGVRSLGAAPHAPAGALSAGAAARRRARTCERIRSALADPGDRGGRHVSLGPRAGRTSGGVSRHRPGARARRRTRRCFRHLPFRSRVSQVAGRAAARSGLRRGGSHRRVLVRLGAPGTERTTSPPRLGPRRHLHRRCSDHRRARTPTGRPPPRASAGGEGTERQRGAFPGPH